METSQNNEENKINNELTYQDESQKVVTFNKKRKITPGTNAARKLDIENQRWLQEIKKLLQLTEEIDADPTSETTTHSTPIAKPPPIFLEAQIIDPFINLLNNIIGKDNYTIKQTKLEQVKIQTNGPEIYRKVIKALKGKNAIYHTYQLKAEGSYKIVIRGLHPKINTKKLNELAKIGQQEQ